MKYKLSDLKLKKYKVINIKNSKIKYGNFM